MKEYFDAFEKTLPIYIFPKKKFLAFQDSFKMSYFETIIIIQYKIAFKGDKTHLKIIINEKNTNFGCVTPGHGDCRK